MTRVQPYQFAEVEQNFTSKAARYVGRRYGRYGVTFDDARSEALVWLYAHEKRVREWLAADPQRTTRIYRSLLDAAMQYAEQEKADRCGYEVSDVEWYTPRMIEGLLPLALDPTFDGLTSSGDGPKSTGGALASQGNEALVAVLDIRRALARSPEWVQAAVGREPGYTGWDDAIQHLINLLGGSLGRVGQRRVLSNAAAQSVTNHQESE